MTVERIVELVSHKTIYPEILNVVEVYKRKLSVINGSYYCPGRETSTSCSHCFQSA